MISCVKKLLSSPVFVSSGIMTASLLFLASALTAEHIFGLKPCILCLYQRGPYVLTAILGFAGLLFARKAPAKTALTVFIAALVFFGESALAFYHVGVEQHWWVSIFEACKVSFDTASDGESLLASIQNTTAVRCDEIPWQMFGVSMAGYNVITALCMGLGSLLSSIFIMRKLNGML